MRPNQFVQDHKKCESALFNITHVCKLGLTVMHTCCLLQDLWDLSRILWKYLANFMLQARKCLISCMFCATVLWDFFAVRPSYSKRRNAVHAHINTPGLSPLVATASAVHLLLSLLLAQTREFRRAWVLDGLTPNPPYTRMHLPIFTEQCPYLKTN